MRKHNGVGVLLSALQEKGPQKTQEQHLHSRGIGGIIHARGEIKMFEVNVIVLSKIHIENTDECLITLSLLPFIPLIMAPNGG